MNGLQVESHQHQPEHDNLDQQYRQHTHEGRDYYAHPPSRQPRRSATSDSSPTKTTTTTTTHTRSDTSGSQHASPGTSSASSSKSTASTMSTSPEGGPSTVSKSFAAVDKQQPEAHHTTPPRRNRIEDSAGDAPMNVDQQQQAHDSVPLSGPHAGTPGKVRRASELSSGQSASTGPVAADFDQSHARKRQARKAFASSNDRDDYFGTGPFESSSAGSRTNSPRQTSSRVPSEGSVQQQQRQHVDMVNYPAADLLRRLAALLEQIARTNDELARQRQLSEASGSATPARGASSAGSSDDGMSDSRTFDVAPLNSPVTPRNRLLPLTSITTLPDLRRPATPGGNLSTDHQLFAVGLTASRSRRSSMDLTRQSRSQPLTDAPPSVSPHFQNDETSTYDDNHLQAAPGSGLLTAASLALSSPSATLCFHARNVPAISIEAYLQRILKYCPTTNEVFVSLLVYFDRMARIGQQTTGQFPMSTGRSDDSSPSTPIENRSLVIDSYNVHRLIIAGITVASKFFSDVFYTNSRYAKVGGLPLSELNQLELQFLLLNNFDLYIPVEELQRYADQLLIHWNGQQPGSSATTRRPMSTEPVPPVPSSTTPSATTMTSNQRSPSDSNRSAGSVSNNHHASQSQSHSQSASTNSPSTRSSFSNSDTSGTSTVTPGSSNSTPSVYQHDGGHQLQQQQQQQQYGQDEEASWEGGDSVQGVDDSDRMQQD